ncbi:MAG: RNA polymerase sigma-70 factor [Bacteroidales bacterium]|nr:RNA polymerase sigma-70 factor [Bacteroidales bacterium]
MEKDKNYKENNKINNLKDYEMIFHKYYNPLVVYANTLLKDIDETQDIVQQVFVSVWEKRNEIEFHTSVRAFLYKSVYNSCINFIKQKTIRNDYLKEARFTEENPLFNDTASHKELQTKIDYAIDSLPEQCRKIFRMSRYDEMKYREIADKLNLSVKTVENQMGKALKVLREHLKEFLSIIIIFLIKLLS